MELADHRRFRHHRPVKAPLPDNGPQIFLLHLMVPGDLLITAAIDTKRLAKRQMDIKADAVFGIALLEPAHEIGLPAVRIRDILPEWYSGIAGITGHRLVITM